MPVLNLPLRFYFDTLKAGIALVSLYQGPNVVEM